MAELVRAMEAYLIERDLRPRPYRWQQPGEVFLEKPRRARAAVSTLA